MKLGGAQHSTAQHGTANTLTAHRAQHKTHTAPHLGEKPHRHQRNSNLPSHCSLRTVIVFKPTLGQTWPQASLWPQYAFKMSMLKAVCDSH